MRKVLREHWALWLVILYLVLVVLLYMIAGPERARFAIADNLDLFQAQYQMLKNTDTFFAQDVSAPFLHGVTRNDLPSELSLSSILYMVLPSYWAYIAVYEVKVVLSVISFGLLSRELDKRGLVRRSSYGDPWNLTILAGFSYGLLNLFPAYGISFSSIPLIIWLLLVLDRTGKNAAGKPLPKTGRIRAKLILLYAAIFCYPFVSYFSYFGLFILLWSFYPRLHVHRLALDIYCKKEAQPQAFFCDRHPFPRQYDL